ncbi:glycosyltransferase [Flavobacterium sp. CYK-55]|uniref:glycosyltransferase n=1 Tax=Flavobacterium sp. CYK-55 TaxID=2835529 RepID=UPI001BCFB85C|nr:glycosyltransferase [Flavobacterium sp. CYK-55]MBS7786734.1 glycosyltransferase [Flavobacterium sp. CYK-55]
MQFSIIIPVYNRPDEIDELLDSLTKQDYKQKFEVIIIEDGSTLPSLSVLEKYKGKLQMTYLSKSNTGPGDSRNYGMKHANGDYFILFDSDCIIPNNYLSEVEKAFQINYVDCFGGPDKALKSFSNIQKAINFSMTSFLTTGGIRGGSEKVNKFQPRSFNMGISKKAFEASGGFGSIHPGEDPDLSIRLWQLGFETRLFSEAYVYHKRRIDWDRFYTQVNKFGKARPILDSWHPAYQKWSYVFPTLFILGFYGALFLLIFAQDALLKFYFIYFLILMLVSTFQNKSLVIGFLSIRATWNQFQGYGLGYMQSFIKIRLLKQQPEKAFPELFFKK